jgi:predicted transcriptional regulator
MAFIAERPGLSAWELSGLSGLSYAQCSKGLQKLRDIEAVKYEAEERESGGIRYRFYPKEDYEVQRDRVAEMGHAYATLKEYKNQ